MQSIRSRLQRIEDSLGEVQCQACHSQLSVLVGTESEIEQQKRDHPVWLYDADGRRACRRCGRPATARTLVALTASPEAG